MSDSETPAVRSGRESRSGAWPGVVTARSDEALRRDTLVDRLDLDVATGRTFGLVRPNGAGKTTTLSVATGLLRPDAGRAWLLGHDVWTDPPAAKAAVGVLAVGPVAQVRGIPLSSSGSSNSSACRHRRRDAATGETRAAPPDRSAACGGPGRSGGPGRQGLADEGADRRRLEQETVVPERGRKHPDAVAGGDVTGQFLL